MRLTAVSPRRQRVLGGVENQITGLQHGWALGTATTEQRPDVGEQHHERERLRDEVVGTGVETLGLIDAHRLWP